MKYNRIFITIVFSFILMNCTKKVEFSAWSVNTEPTSNKIYDDKFQGFYKGSSQRSQCENLYNIKDFASRLTIEGFILNGTFYFKINEKEAIGLQIYNDGFMGGKIFIQNNKDNEPIYWLFFGQIKDMKITFYVGLGTDDIEEEEFNCSYQPFILTKRQTPVMDNYLTTILAKSTKEMIQIQNNYKNSTFCKINQQDRIEQLIAHVLRFSQNSMKELQIEYAAINFALSELENFYLIAVQKKCELESAILKQEIKSILNNTKYGSENVRMILENKYNHLFH